MSFITPLSFDINTVRNQPDGVAGINASKTLLNEHRPVCTKEYALYGKYLDGADNPDVWFPITGGNGTIVYSSRYLTITGSTNGTNAANRAVIDKTKFPISSNFIECTVKYEGGSIGGGTGVWYCAFGFGSAFSSMPSSERALFFIDRIGNSYVSYRGGSKGLKNLPIGRNLQAGDICTVRLDRQAGSSNIDIARFYVNGQKQFEVTRIPTVDVYAGIGVFTDSDTTVAPSIVIDYFGVKYVP